MRIQLNQNRPARRGFTLMEILITSAISTLLFAAVAGISIYAGRSLTALVNYADLETQSRYALDRMTPEIRQAVSLVTIGSNTLAFYDVNTQLVTYSFSSVSNTLTRTSGTNSSAYLTNCDSLTFSYYQQDIRPADYSMPTANDVNSCSVISVSWVCSKQIFGLSLNTEDVRMATLILRNKL